jgi:DNA-binding PadR family transcriptional regulator
VSSTRLLVLGVVRSRQPVHGYALVRELMSWKVDLWAGVKSGSIYHALAKMADEGLLERVDVDQVGGRPARTPYRLTAPGEREYQRLLHHELWGYRQVVDPFQVAFTLVRDVPPAEAAGALRHRAQLLRGWCEGVEASLDGPVEEWSHQPPHVAEMLRLAVGRSRAEIEWCERVADRAEKGELAD